MEESDEAAQPFPGPVVACDVALLAARGAGADFAGRPKRAAMLMVLSRLRRVVARTAVALLALSASADLLANAPSGRAEATAAATILPAVRGEAAAIELAAPGLAAPVPLPGGERSVRRRPCPADDGLARPGCVLVIVEMR